jgi:glycerol-3-phosphate acyltransferase PlsY
VRAWRSERLEAEWPIWGLTVVLALLVIFRHRSNIGRMLHGQELKLGAGHAAEGNGK